jgi:hypothetical protein
MIQIVKSSIGAKYLSIKIRFKIIQIIKLTHFLIKKLWITNIRPVIGFVDFNPKFS